VSALGALRPVHWIGIGLIAAVIATGAWTNVLGLLGGNTSEAKRLSSCLQHHGVNVASLATSIGNPVTLLNGARALDQEIHGASKRGKLKGSEANAVTSCVRRLAH
jgi:hypothetical protein